VTYRVGVDIGGTFTDAIAIDDLGVILTAKALTTPTRLSDGVVDAISGLGIDFKLTEYFVHGTTAGLNAFLERRGARVALITTRGFRDVYEIGRANRPDMYNLKYKVPTPLVPRADIFEIDERISAEGDVITAVDLEDLKRIVNQVLGKYDVIAVVLLHSYKKPLHEEQVADYLRVELPNTLVVCSHVVAPEWREFERTSTTAISAYIAPIIDGYLLELGNRLSDLGLRSDLKVMQSNGGVMSAQIARRLPIQTLFSGPVGGTIACVEIGKTLKLDRLICVDMGGTSFDVSLVINQRADIEPQAMLEGLPILSPTVSMHTIGAGGGSVAYVSAGAMRVGPRSAGAFPGPACYARGGIEPTVTDANLVLGRLPQSAKLGGSLALDFDQAKAALDSVGRQLELTTEQTADGIVTIVNASMADAIREITVSRGIDPREFALVAFGGAGPLHAIAIAEELELGSVIVPANPGVLSAWGMLQADTRRDLVMNYYTILDLVTDQEFDSAVKNLLDLSRNHLAEVGVDGDGMLFQPAADLRYLGQEYTVTTEWPHHWSAEQALSMLPELFETEHLVRYGHNNPGEKIEIVNIRVTALGKNPKSPLPEGDSTLVESPKTVQKISFYGKWLKLKLCGEIVWRLIP